MKGRGGKGRERERRKGEGEGREGRGRGRGEEVWKGKVRQEEKDDIARKLIPLTCLQGYTCISEETNDLPMILLTIIPGVCC